MNVQLAPLSDYEALLDDMATEVKAWSLDIDATCLSLLLNDLRLPAIKQIPVLPSAPTWKAGRQRAC